MGTVMGAMTGFRGEGTGGWREGAWSALMQARHITKPQMLPPTIIPTALPLPPPPEVAAAVAFCKAAATAAVALAPAAATAAPWGWVRL